MVSNSNIVALYLEKLYQILQHTQGERENEWALGFTMLRDIGMEARSRKDGRILHHTVPHPSGRKFYGMMPMVLLLQGYRWAYRVGRLAPIAIYLRML